MDSVEEQGRDAVTWAGNDFELDILLSHVWSNSLKKRPPGNLLTKMCFLMHALRLMNCFHEPRFMNVLRRQEAIRAAVWEEAQEETQVGLEFQFV